MTFAALFGALWWLFYVHQTYSSQVKRGMDSSLVLKQVLVHVEVIFGHFGGHFASIGSIVAKIRAETSLYWL